ncbi:hypothetical protein OROHE_012004 [Orobanche hederae]
MARILVFKIRPSQDILKIRDGTPLEAEGILTYREKPSKLLEPSQEILKIRDEPSQDILKIRDGTPLEAEGILTYRKRPSQEILKIRDEPSQEILKILDGTPLEAEGILTFRKRPCQDILKIRDGTPLEAEGILTYRKSPRNCSVWHFSSKLDVPSNVVQKKRVSRILVFKIRPSQEILKIRDGTPLEAEGILTYRKRTSQEILKIRDEPSQDILKIRDGTPLECPSQEILKIRDVTPLEKIVARILVFKIRPSQDILKIRDGTPLEAEGILTYREKPSKLIKILKIRDGSTPLEAEGILTYRKRPSQEILKIRDEILKIRDVTPLEKIVARTLVFKIRPCQDILKIRDGTPLEAEGILTYRKSPRNCSVWHFSSKLDVPSNVVQKKRVSRILVFKIRPSQEILKIRDGTPLEAEGILTYRKRPSKLNEILKIRDGTPLEKIVARILVFKIRPSQDILKIRDGTPLEAEGILTYREKPSKLLEPSQEILKIRDGTPLEWPSQDILKIRDVPSQEILKIRDGTPLEIQKKIVARILVFKIRPSQDILKIRDGTPLEAEGILTYRKSPRNCSVWDFSSKLDVPSNVVQKKRVSQILVFKIRPSQEILKIRDGTPLEAEGILTYRKRPSQEILKIRDEILKILDVQKKIVARILVFKIRPSQDILKIRDGTPLEAEGILTYRKSPRNCSVWDFSSKLDVPSNVVQKKRVSRILVFKIRPSQEILKIRDGTPLEAEGILTYRKRPSKLIVAGILVFKIRPSQEILKIRDGTPLEWPCQDILKIRDGTPLEAEGILTYRKSPRNCSVWHFSSKLDVTSNVVQKKRVSRILVFKIRPSQEILKIRDGTPLEAEGILTFRKRVAGILVFKIRPSQEILKIRDGTPLEWPSQDILKIRDEPSQDILKIRDVPSQEILKIRDDILKIRDVQKKIVARILVFKIRPSQDILKIRDGTPLEAEGILTYRKSPRNCSVWHFSSKLDVPSNIVQKKRVSRILVFKIRPSQEILKIRDGTPLEAEGILTYRKRPSKLLVAGILVFKIRASQEILKIRDGTPLEAEGILTYRKSPRNCSVWHFSSKLDVPSNIVQKKRVSRILVFKIRPSQEILKIRDGTPLEAEGILTYRKRPCQDILKIRDGTPLEAEGILTYRKSPRNCSVWHFSSKLDVPSNIVQKKRVSRILVFKIRPSQEILKIRDGTPLEAEGILTYRKRPSKLIEPCQDILKIRDGTPLEAEGILTYRKSPRNCSVWHFSSKLDVTSNVVQKKRVSRILVFKIRPSQEILKIRDGTPLKAEGILTFRKRPSQEILKIRDEPCQDILKIRDGTPLEAEGILTYRKSPRNCSVWHFSSKLDVTSNVVQKKRVSRILVFKIRPSQEILKIRDGTPLKAEGILTFRKRPSQEILKIRDDILKIRDGTPLELPCQDILKIRDGTPLEAEGILTYRKSPRNCSVWHFSSKLDVTSNVVQKKRVSRILVFKIRPSQEILKIRDGTPLKAEGILTFRKRPSQDILKIRDVAGILVFKIRPSQEILKIRDEPSQDILKIRDGTPLEMPCQDILKIRDGTPLEAEGILTYRKSPRNCSVWHFSSKLDVTSNVVQKKRVSRILVFKIRPSQEILKIRDGTPLKAEGILTFRKRPSQDILKIRDVAGILVFKIRPSQEILKIRDDILKIRDVQKKIVARILVFKIRPSQDILKIRDGTPLEAEGILTYRKSPRNCSVWHFSSKLDVPSNIVQKKRVSRILVFKIRPSQEILKIRDGTPLEAEGILTYRKRPSKLLGLALF